MGVKKESPKQGKLAVAKEATRTFIGKAWVNKASKGEHKGTEYLNVTLDQGISEVVMSKGSRLLLWPNEKREGTNPKTGKEYFDADFRVSLIEA